MQQVCPVKMDTMSFVEIRHGGEKPYRGSWLGRDVEKMSRDIFISAFLGFLFQFCLSFLWQCFAPKIPKLFHVCLLAFVFLLPYPVELCPPNSLGEVQGDLPLGDKMILFFNI